ncbi:hypothetical protein CMI37_03500 [Candidatus Pacearchaeota archaeon]|nr:hypothetical protein [Candidatus Pacearchaeota archaeon]|tara:strand:+ start:3049 stop:3234 length:186 start_codon:yes stop_codon:yes gene_type:complete
MGESGWEGVFTDVIFSPPYRELFTKQIQDFLMWLLGQAPPEFCKELLAIIKERGLLEADGE